MLSNTVKPKVVIILKLTSGLVFSSLSSSPSIERIFVSVFSLPHIRKTRTIFCLSNGDDEEPMDETDPVLEADDLSTRCALPADIELYSCSFLALISFSSARL